MLPQSFGVGHGVSINATQRTITVETRKDLHLEDEIIKYICISDADDFINVGLNFG